MAGASTRQPAQAQARRPVGELHTVWQIARHHACTGQAPAGASGCSSCQLLASSPSPATYPGRPPPLPCSTVVNMARMRAPRARLLLLVLGAVFVALAAGEFLDAV